MGKKGRSVICLFPKPHASICLLFSSPQQICEPKEPYHIVAPSPPCGLTMDFISLKIVRRRNKSGAWLLQFATIAITSFSFDLQFSTLLSSLFLMLWWVTSKDLGGDFWVCWDEGWFMGGGLIVEGLIIQGYWNDWVKTKLQKIWLVVSVSWGEEDVGGFILNDDEALEY